MEGHAKKCVERYCELAYKMTQQLNQVATPCLDDHQFKDDENELSRELSTVCSQMVLKCLYLARIGRPDILWSVNKLARAVTKWTKTCDKRLARLISYVHHTCEYKQYCYVGGTAQHCRLGLFQDSDFSGGGLEIKHQEGSCAFSEFQTFVPVSWMCKKQTSVSNSSTEADIMSLDAGLQFQPRTRIPDQTNIDHVQSSGTHYGSNAMSHVSRKPTELLWIGCLTELILILKFKFDTLTPIINSQTRHTLSPETYAVSFCSFGEEGGGGEVGGVTWHVQLQFLAPVELFSQQVNGCSAQIT